MTYSKCLLMALILSAFAISACSSDSSTSSGTSPSLQALNANLRQGGQTTLIATGFRDAAGNLATGGNLLITSTLPGTTIGTCTLSSGACNTTYTASTTNTGLDQVNASYVPGNSSAPRIFINVF